MAFSTSINFAQESQGSKCLMWSEHIKTGIAKASRALIHNLELYTIDAQHLMRSQDCKTSFSQAGPRGHTALIRLSTEASFDSSENGMRFQIMIHADTPL